MERAQNLKEQVKHGNSDYHFKIYHSSPFANIHWHDEVEILCIYEGTLIIEIAGVEYLGKAGDVFVVNKSELHQMYRKSKNTRYDAFVFGFDMLSFSLEDTAQLQYIHPFAEGNIQFCNKPQRNPYYLSLFQRISNCNFEKKSGYMIATKAALLEFISLMLDNRQCYLTEIEGKTTKDSLLKDIVAYIEKRISEKITLEEISENFNMVPKYFCRFFKQKFNKTLIEYINGLRVERAMTMMQSPNRNITEIAVSLGFSNMSYFAKVFKKITGYTPSQYRKQL